jgi:DNA mismatch repair protein MutL
VTGWLASPRVTRSTSRSIYLFVNGRWVRDKVILHALFDGYSQRLVKGQYPLAVLFISVPFDQVDVNVHPTKHQIRFVRQRFVHDAIRDGVAGLLNEVDRPAWAPQTYGREPSGSNPAGDSAFRKPPNALEPGYGPRERIAGFGFQTPDSERWAKESVNADGTQNRRNEERGFRFPVSPVRSRQPGSPDQAEIWETRKFASLRVIGQLRNTYVICESEDGLLLIDQHAAHERIYYEQLKKQAAGKTTAVQNLLVLETVELGFREAEGLAHHLADLSELGLQIEPFGGNTFVIKAVPAMLAGQAIKPLVIEIAEKLAATGYSDDLEASIDATIQLMACHGAIRASQSLSERQIEVLLQQLDGCANPSHCPHGRPTWVQLSLYEMEKMFKRKV